MNENVLESWNQRCIMTLYLGIYLFCLGNYNRRLKYLSDMQNFSNTSE